MEAHNWSWLTSGCCLVMRLKYSQWWPSLSFGYKLIRASNSANPQHRALQFFSVFWSTMASPASRVAIFILRVLSFILLLISLIVLTTSATTGEVGIDQTIRIHFNDINAYRWSSSEYSCSWSFFLSFVFQYDYNIYYDN